MRMLMLDCLQRLCFYDHPELSFVSTPFPSNATVSFLLAATDVTVDVPLMQYLTCKEKEIVFWLQGVNQCCNSGLQSSRFCLVDCCQHGILKCTKPYNSRKAQHFKVSTAFLYAACICTYIGIDWKLHMGSNVCVC